MTPLGTLDAIIAARLCFRSPAINDKLAGSQMAGAILFATTRSMSERGTDEAKGLE
ncbi:hypothetical protein SAMN07250955_11097 [Arboricoccus pini]|uniref:Uncharacterized protein n=1 Tax=Arboricoccus pini TaxID=1963835 RepID=A0A212RLR3_9PROT|nr:hypothetical protein SAMN07250955_11097 [Arboricoccus pini]